jgi:hypothetical protein
LPATILSRGCNHFPMHNSIFVLNLLSTPLTLTYILSITQFGTLFHISYEFYFMPLYTFWLTPSPDQVPLSHTSAEATIATYNIFSVSAIRDLFYIYTNFFR